jgi:hypothetical protein
MNVAKPGGPAGPGPSSPDGASGGMGGANPAGPERKFADVLANKGQDPSQVSSANRAQPFRAPILDDGPVRMSAQGAQPIGRANDVNRTQRVNGPARTLEVHGEKVGRGPGAVDQPGGSQPPGAPWQRMADDTFKSESRIDNLIKAAQGGKSFNASELMALQVEVFRYSQTVEVISRTTDKLVGAVKQTLGTQV